MPISAGKGERWLDRRRLLAGMQRAAVARLRLLQSRLSAFPRSPDRTRQVIVDARHDGHAAAKPLNRPRVGLDLVNAVDDDMVQRFRQPVYLRAIAKEPDVADSAWPQPASPWFGESHLL